MGWASVGKDKEKLSLVFLELGGHLSVVDLSLCPHPSLSEEKDTMATSFSLLLLQYVHFISADFLQTWFKDLSSIPLVYICRGPFVKLIRKWAFACGVGGGDGN